MIAISLPFGVDGYGRVTTTRNELKIWADRVRFVITTFVGERVMRPTWGANIPSDLFGALEDTPALVYGDIQAAFQDYLPSLTLVDVVLLDEDSENGTIELEVQYQVPQVTDETQTASMTLQTD